MDDRCGGKYQSVTGLIKGLVREPFVPCQRLGTGLEPSSPLTLWQRQLFPEDSVPQAGAETTPALHFLASVVHFPPALFG